ncbi:hypothetical protein OIU76_016423 [Salix suchowensis]|nr:hypothetical protein OIU76_016423 [Salix suchowensis]
MLGIVPISSLSFGSYSLSSLLSKICFEPFMDPFSSVCLDVLMLFKSPLLSPP